MIEDVVNILDLVVLGACLAIALYRGLASRKRPWALFILALIAFFLGSLWWFLYLFYLPEDVPGSVIPYFNWCASRLFLLLLMGQFPHRPLSRREHGALWLVPVFTAGMALFYMQWGSYLENVLDALMMGILLRNAVAGLLALRGESGPEAATRGVFRAILIYCLLEYTVWTVSCLDYDHPLRHLYYVFDLLLAASAFLLFPALEKAVEE